MLDRVCSVFILPAPRCHNCSLPPVDEAHPGKGIWATPGFILVSLKLLLNFQQLILENRCWAQRWELHAKNALCHSKQTLLSELNLEALRVKEKLFELFQGSFHISYFQYFHIPLLISHLFPKKMDSLWKRTENICKPVANSGPQRTGINNKQKLSNMSFPTRAGKMSVQVFWTFDFSLVLLRT